VVPLPWFYHQEEKKRENLENLKYLTHYLIIGSKEGKRRRCLLYLISRSSGCWREKNQIIITRKGEKERKKRKERFTPLFFRLGFLEL